MATTTITANGTQRVISVGSNRSGGNYWLATFGIDALGGATVALFLSYNSGTTLIPLPDNFGNNISFSAAGVKTSMPLGSPSDLNDRMDIYATTSGFTAPINLRVNTN